MQIKHIAALVSKMKPDMNQLVQCEPLSLMALSTILLLGFWVFYV
jgi:hypothetical protein